MNREYKKVGRFHAFYAWVGFYIILALSAVIVAGLMIYFTQAILDGDMPNVIRFIIHPFIS